MEVLQGVHPVTTVTPAEVEIDPVGHAWHTVFTLLLHADTW